MKAPKHLKQHISADCVFDGAKEGQRD